MPLKEEKKDKIESVYIHIPFCKEICSYCDFCKVYYNEKFVNDYLQALGKEIELYYKKEYIKTIYIGGGTPSSLKVNELKKLFKIISKFKLDQDLEFTFECNINDINKEFLELLKKNNVNRLSIGVESFNKNILRTLGRDNFKTKDKILLAKKYFSNINIDLIYGIYNQTLNDLKQDLKEFLKLDIPHISIYSLILERNTLLEINNYQELDEDIVRDMYDTICKELKDNNYIHYEISNFSKKGYESKHNLTYWHNNKYYGFGCGASGYINNVRYNNTRSITNYIKGKFRLDEEIIDKKTDMENFMILGLRLIEGINSKDFKEKYNSEIKDIFDVKKLNYKNNMYYIKEEDLFISNSILKDFINI